MRLCPCEGAGALCACGRRFVVCVQGRVHLWGGRWSGRGGPGASASRAETAGESGVGSVLGRVGLGARRRRGK